MIPKAGPPLDLLLHRLSECPAEFLLEPHLKESGIINVAALVCDYFRQWGMDPHPEKNFQEFGPGSVCSGNHLKMISVAVWLLSDPWFTERRDLGNQVWEVYSNGLGDLSSVVNASAVINDPDRREEFARYCISLLGMLPAGETEQQALDRLAMFDSVERIRVIRATREAEAWAGKVRRAMAQKAAETAAAKVSRE